MPKTKEDYVRDIMGIWNANHIFGGSNNEDLNGLADKMTGINYKKDAQEVEAIQNAINSVQSPFKLTWGEAISAFFKGAFSLSSSVQAERETIVAGKLADAIVPAVKQYESDKAIAPQKVADEQSKAQQQSKEIAKSKPEIVNGREVYGNHSRNVVLKGKGAKAQSLTPNPNQ